MFKWIINLFRGKKFAPEDNYEYEPEDRHYFY